MPGAGGQGVRAERPPGGIRQVRGRFHYDDDPGRAGDGEPELVTSHAEVGVPRLHLRIPKHSGERGEGRPPT